MPQSQGRHGYHTKHHEGITRVLCFATVCLLLWFAPSCKGLQDVVQHGIVSRPGRDILANSGTSRVIKPAIFLLKICDDSSPASTPQDILQKLNSKLAPLVSQCSFGAAALQLDSSAIFTNISIPCYGEDPLNPNFAFDATRCNDDDAIAWANVANQQVAAAHPTFPLASYPFRIYILSSKSNTPCEWRGSALPACAAPPSNPSAPSASPCSLWLTSDTTATAASLAAVTIHELGHNLGLNHSWQDYPVNIGGVELSDQSGVMGYPTAPLCYNPPQQLQLGWAGPYLTLTSAMLPLNQVKQVILPAFTSTPTSLLLLALCPGPAPNLLALSYLTPTGPLSSLPPYYSNKLNIYELPNPSPQNYTKHLYALPPFPSSYQQWIPESPPIAIRLIHVTATSATVAICRYADGDPSLCNFDKPSPPLPSAPYTGTTLCGKPLPWPSTTHATPSPSPLRKSPSPPKSPPKRSPSPPKRPPQRPSPSPPRKSPSPPKKKSPSPLRKPPSHLKKKSPSPARKPPSPLKKKSPSPARKPPSPPKPKPRPPARKPPSPKRKKTPSPVRRPPSPPKK